MLITTAAISLFFIVLVAFAAWKSLPQKKSVNSQTKSTKRIDHDPIKDEFKQYTLEEFVQILSEMTEEYGDLSLENEWRLQKHTFTEWMGSFGRWMSW